jgi:hypothetical protein
LVREAVAQPNKGQTTRAAYNYGGKRCLSIKIVRALSLVARPLRMSSRLHGLARKYREREKGKIERRRSGEEKRSLSFPFSISHCTNAPCQVSADSCERCEFPKFFHVLCALSGCATEGLQEGGEENATDSGNDESADGVTGRESRWLFFFSFCVASSTCGIFRTCRRATSSKSRRRFSRVSRFSRIAEKTDLLYLTKCGCLEQFFRI